jgi:hypothetical protein
MKGEGKIALSLIRHKATTYGWVQSSKLCKTVLQVDKLGMQECVITITGKSRLPQSLRNNTNTYYMTLLYS